jgi:hypothetical protein
VLTFRLGVVEGRFTTNEEVEGKFMPSMEEIIGYIRLIIKLEDVGKFATSTQQPMLDMNVGRCVCD